MGTKAFCVFAAFLTVLLIGQAVSETLLGKIFCIIGESGTWCTCIATIFNNYVDDTEDGDGS